LFFGKKKGIIETLFKKKKMQNNLLKKIGNLIKTEKQLFFVSLFLLVTFLVNQTLYSGQKTTAENCAGGKCTKEIVEKPQLSKDNDYYYLDDLFKDQPSGYYRLTFQEKSTQAERIFLKLNTYTEKEKQIADLTFSSSDGFKNQEVFFFLPEGFDSLLFQREKSASVGEVFLKSAGITKLNITNEKELALMQKTIIGETDASAVKIDQLISDYAFPWLRESNTMLGQVFKANEDTISSVAFKINTSKNLNPGSRQYTLILREVNYDGKNVSFSGPIIASLGFSLSSIEKYRQEDGTFLFPLYGKLEKDKYYLIGLDNSKVAVSDQNYLEFRGEKNDNSYLEGSAVMKKGKEIYKIDGDFYFKIYGANFFYADNTKILNGAKIEDLGKGLGKYSYQTKGKNTDLLDLDFASPGTGFNEINRVIFASGKDEANFIYAVNTLYPISKLNFSATQLKVSWKKIEASYSFDRNIWIDLPFSEKAELASSANFEPESDTAEAEEIDNSEDADSADNSSGTATEEVLQFFDADIIPEKTVRTIYFKITYDKNDSGKGKSFALKNLKITADLKMK
jgi:hypothetical protein